MKIIEIPPSASRTIEGYSKGLGYKFETACADLLDNSLAAKSSIIKIDMKVPGLDHPSFAVICDNGSGMDYASLIEAMRLGTRKKYTSKTELGKYGLGLKTASLSQTDTLTVVTREKNSNKTFIARLDVHQIKKNDKWEIQFLDKNELSEWMKKLIENQIGKKQGTLVILENLHMFKNIDKDTIQESFDRSEHDLRIHLSMVFHRFLKRKKVFVNGSLLTPWDPFCEKEKTRKLPALKLMCHDAAGIKRPISLKAHILPTEKEFSSKAAWEEASGPKRWNSQQGFYFYRKNRLLTSGGWANCDGRFEEHQKLLRISVDFPEQLDEIANLNINKMQAGIPSEIKRCVQDKLIDWRRIAEARYRSKNILNEKSKSRGRGSLFKFLPSDKLEIKKEGLSVKVKYNPKATPKKIQRLIHSSKTNQIISMLCLILQNGKSSKVSEIFKSPREILNMILK